MSAVETVVAPVVAEPTTPIKPSEALRLGRLVRPRRIEIHAFDGEDGACAIGAISFGGMSSDWGYEPAVCPEPRGRRCAGFREVFDVTVHLNDGHHWSDDQIVAWLESMDL